MKFKIYHLFIVCISILTLSLSNCVTLSLVYADTTDAHDSGASKTESSDSDSDEIDDGEEIDAGEIEVGADRSPTSESLPGLDAIYIEFDDFDSGIGGVAALLDSAGLDVRSLGGAHDLSVLSVRGAAPHQSSLYLNGIPLSPETSGVFDLSLLPIGAAHGALIERGCGSLGGFAGGVDLRLSALSNSSFRVSYGSFDSRLISAEIPFSLGTSRGSVFAAHSSTDGDFPFVRHDGFYYTRTNNDRTLNSLAVVLENGNDKVSRNLTLVVSNKIGGVPGLSEYPSPDARQEDTVALAGYTYTDKSCYDGELASSIYARLSQTSFDDPTPFLGNAIKTNQSEFSAGASVQYRRPYANSIFGAKLNIDTVKLDDDDYGNPARTTSDFTTWNEFYLDELTLTTALSASADSDDEHSWKANTGIVYDLGRGFKIEGSAARSFRRPNFSELFYPESGYIGGNPNLDSERGLFFDLGLRYDSELLDITVRGFNQRFDESIQFVPVTLYRIRAENTGAVRIRGILAETVYEFNDEMKLSASITKLDAEYLDGGLPMAGRTPFKYSIALNGEHAKFEWRIGWLHEDSAPVDRFGSLRSPASDDLTCALQLELNDGIALTFSASNLLDDDLRDSLDFPLPGRNFEVGFKYSW